MRDTKEIINCPACGKEMKKVYSQENGFYVDVCTNGCGGMFFDNRELKKFDENKESIDFLLKEIEGKTFRSTDTPNKRICPVCCAVMVKNYTDFNKNIEIDECYSCGGIFLDNGEIQKMRAEYNTEDERREEFRKFFINEYNKVKNQYK